MLERWELIRVCNSIDIDRILFLVELKKDREFMNNKTAEEIWRDGYAEGYHAGMTYKGEGLALGGAPIIVCDETLRDFHDSEFKKYLEEEGFAVWKKGRNFETSHVYVNINSKIYARGMPGIRLTDNFGEHAVTIEEFKIIYNIYKKYEGKKLLDME